MERKLEKNILFCASLLERAKFQGENVGGESRQTVLELLFTMGLHKKMDKAKQFRKWFIVSDSRDQQFTSAK